MLMLSGRFIASRCLLPRNIYCGVSSALMNHGAQKSTGGRLITDEEFVEKNTRLNRPMSPHLTVYKPQLTSMMSISHRFTGMALGGIISGFAIGALVLPGSFPHYLDWFSSIQFGPAIIYSLKFSMAFVFSYHMCNAARHLGWDLGKGTRLSTLYQTGWITLGTSFVVAVVLAAL